GASRPAKAKAPGGQETRGLGHPQRRRMADRKRNAENGAEAADGGTRLAGCAQLVLARIRYARRVLAAVQGAYGAEHAGDIGLECKRMQFLSARCFSRARGRL